MSWNEALKAYEENLSILEGIRYEYQLFLRSLFDEVKQKVVGKTGLEFNDEEKEGAGQIVFKWKDREKDWISVEMWASGPFEGPSGFIRVGLSLNLEKALEEIDTPGGREALLEAIQKEISKNKEITETDRPEDVRVVNPCDCFLLSSFEIDQPELTEALAKKILRYSEESQQFINAIIAVWEQDPYSWVQLRLYEIINDEPKMPIQNVDWYWGNGYFAGGWYIEASGMFYKNSFGVDIIVLPSGEIELCYWSSKYHGDSIFNDDCFKKLELSDRRDVDGYPVGRYLDLDDIKKHMIENTKNDFKKKIINVCCVFMKALKNKYKN